MKNKFLNEREILIQKIEELHELTVEAYEVFGGTYEENLNGAINYFNFNGTHFKMTIEKV